MSLFYYDDYEIDPKSTRLDVADYVFEDVIPIRTGARISGFTKISNCAEITRLRNENVICYVPDQQRGWRIKYREGAATSQSYLIKKDKVKQIAKNIAENSEHNRFRTANCRHGHVSLYFEPYERRGDRAPDSGRLFIFRDDAEDGIEGLLTTPDSAHRQEGDRYFTETLAGGKNPSFSPAHEQFSPETYDLILHITLTDEQGEGEAHYEHNELITKSAATRRDFLEGGKQEPANWVGHELMRMNSTTKDLVEIYEKSISKNSPKLVTFSALTKGIEEGWGTTLSDGTEATKRMVARELDAALKMSREEVPEWGPLTFAKRTYERENHLYSQAIVLRSMLRIFADWHQQDLREGLKPSWDRWRAVLRALKQPYTYQYSDGSRPPWEGEFLSRRNPLFYAEAGGGIYQMNKSAQKEKGAADREGKRFEIDPLHHLTVQNTRLSLDYMYTQLQRLFDRARATAESGTVEK